MPTQLQSQISSIPRGIIRSTGIGGLLVAGIAVLLYVRFPAYITLVDRHWFYIAYTAIGAALAKMIKHTWFSARNPPPKSATFNEKLKELDILLEQRRISAATHQYLVNKLCEKEFLGELSP